MRNRIRVLLIAEDRRDDGPAGLLSKWADLVRAGSPAEALAELSGQSFDLIVISSSIPAAAVPSFLGECLDRSPDTPVIMIAPNSDRAEDLKSRFGNLFTSIPETGLSKELFMKAVDDALQSTGKDADLDFASRMFQDTVEGFFIADDNGVIRIVNKAFCKITGIRSEDAVGQHIGVLVSGQSSGDAGHLWEALKSKGHWHGNIGGRPEDGKIRPALLSISSITGPCRTPKHYMGIVNGIIAGEQGKAPSLQQIQVLDPLTGFLNRDSFKQHFSQVLHQAEKARGSAVILFADLDGFRRINNSFGHDAGDQLLKVVARRLRQCLRQDDIIARFGSDEFAVVLPDSLKEKQGMTVARRILQVLRDPIKVHGHEVHITCSVGVAAYPEDGPDPETLTRNASIAAQFAAEQGGDNLEIYHSRLANRLQEEYELESNLREAIKSGELVLHYQPQLDMETWEITGVEALVRWNHPRLGLYPPARFIPVAEKSGLIIPLGEWVMRRACAQNKQWQDLGLPPVKMAVNLSPRQFLQENLLKQVTETLEATGLDPQWLEIEITETAVIQDTYYTERVLRSLKNIGISVAIDDFGTGYSSLSYLRQFPIDRLKIAQSFISHLTEDLNDAAIVSAVISLAHSLSRKVIAEGVETSEQLRYLKEYRCNAFQGFLFSRPVGSQQVAEMLAHPVKIATL